MCERKKESLEIHTRKVKFLPLIIVEAKKSESFSETESFSFLELKSSVCILLSLFTSVFFLSVK